MIATADSRVKSKIWEITRIERIREDVIVGPVLPKRVKRRCPAIILAANRTANVPGRIMFLIVSINTINGIKTGGVPWGTKWANMCWVWLIHPLIIRVTHRGRERANVITMWLDLVNT